MAHTEKKIAAALAAVNVYLQMEEAAAVQQTPPPDTASPLSAGNAWSQSGRQEMMAMRRLIQIRTFTSIR